MKPAKIFIILSLVLFTGFLSCSKSGDKIGQTIEGATARAVPAFFATTALSQTAGNLSISDVAEKSINSVVSIYSTKKIRSQNNPLFNDPFFRQFFGQNDVPQERIQQGLGSGVIVTKEGIVLTNNHVIEGADQLKVTLYDKREFDAEVIGSDPKTDLAVLRLKGKPDNLLPMPLGDSDKLRLAEVVLAIGNPFGLGHTVTMGIISAKYRETQGIAAYGSFIQTDAAINPGNSGGALINLSGELVGINTAIFSSQSGMGGEAGNQGIGFAIPVNLAKSIMEQLVNKGKVVRGYLGVNIQDIDQNLAESFGLSNSKGVLVSDVVPGSPADKGGIQREDIILSVDGKSVEDSNELRNSIAMSGSDKTVTLKVMRNGRERDVKVKLTELKDEKQTASADNAGPEEESIAGGLTVTALTDQIRNAYKIPSSIKGVMVTDVGDLEGKLNPGDIIREINRKPVDKPEVFAKEYKSSKKIALLYVYRGGASFYLSIAK